jgi:protein TonB
MGSAGRGLKWLAARVGAVLGAAVITLAIFLILPLMQVIGAPPERDLNLAPVEVANLPPPPPPPPEEEPPEPEPQEEPPELAEQSEPLDLSQLELALNPTVGDGGFGEFTIDIGEKLEANVGGDSVDEVFSMAQLDQRPRVIFQREPIYPQELRKRRQNGTVYLVFLVDEQGNVMNPTVKKSSNPAFERPALEAVKQWKFEPGTRKGEPVPFKMAIPIQFSPS